MPCDQKSQNISSCLLITHLKICCCLIPILHFGEIGNELHRRLCQLTCEYKKEYADVEVINLVIKIWNTHDYNDVCRQHVLYFSKLRKK